ncbi:alpha-glucan family phosphorylase [Candidatus Poribacteria bacterium]
MDNEFTHDERVAYFSMEIALRPEIPTYSGGLGILAGDTLRSAADLEIPLVAVSLVSHAGHFRQEFDDQGSQIEHPDPWKPEQWAKPLEAKVSVPMEGRNVWVGGWLYILEGHLGGRQPVILLDTDLNENSQEDRLITHYLYGGDAIYRLNQEIVLGIGGVRMLQALGFRISKYHMNEGHSALLALELLRRYAYMEEDMRPGEPPYDIHVVREHCIFTTHTPVEAGQDQFPYDLVERTLGDFIPMDVLKLLAGDNVMNMTRLALNLSEHINGVAQRHAETSRRLFPGYQIRAITNGVHPYTWASAGFSMLYDEYVKGWCHEPELLVRADRIPDEAVWSAHMQAKGRLIARAKEICGIELNPDLPILGFARRMTDYKRPNLLFSHMGRLRSIAQKLPFQIVLAGKAHPRDESGKHLIELMHAHIRELSGAIPMAYFPNYNMELASTIISGVDVWLNTPLRPYEASGTSGMKAAFNGIPSLSILDGWWIEGCIEGVTGWAIGNESGSPEGDAESLYQKLENVVLPLYYNNRGAWLYLMKQVICKNASFFNSHRMMQRYAIETYIG